VGLDVRSSIYVISITCIEIRQSSKDKLRFKFLAIAVLNLKLCSCIKSITIIISTALDGI